MLGSAILPGSGIRHFLSKGYIRRYSGTPRIHTRRRNCTLVCIDGARADTRREFGIASRFLKNYIRPNLAELLSSRRCVRSTYADQMARPRERNDSQAFGIPGASRCRPLVLFSSSMSLSSSSPSSSSSSSILSGPLGEMRGTPRRSSYVNDFPNVRMG